MLPRYGTSWISSNQSLDSSLIRNSKLLPPLPLSRNGPSGVCLVRMLLSVGSVLVCLVRFLRRLPPLFKPPPRFVLSCSLSLVPFVPLLLSCSLLALFGFYFPSLSLSLFRPLSQRFGGSSADHRSESSDRKTKKRGLVVSSRIPV